MGDTSYKEQYPPYKYNADYTRRDVSNNVRQRGDDISRHSDAHEARSQFSEAQMSVRTRSSKASQQQLKMNEVKLTPMDVREVQVARHEANQSRQAPVPVDTRVRQASRDLSSRSPIPDDTYKRELKRGDTAEWQNPTFKSNIFTEGEKRQPARTSKNWESTVH